jgi:predicted nuclease with TOPRIM domain
MATTYKLPDNTCPIIDEVIEIFEDGVKNGVKLLEQIRKANSQLREAAEWWEENYQQLEKRCDELEDENRDLRETIKFLEGQVDARKTA